MHENYDLDLLLELVEQRKFRSMKELLSQMNEVDIAEFLDELDVEQEILVFRLLPKDTAAEVFTYLENTEDQEKLIGALSDRELREVLDELYLDDTVDIIEDMPANVVSRILRNTDASTRSQINQLLNYPKDSAGHPGSAPPWRSPHSPAPSRASRGLCRPGARPPLSQGAALGGERGRLPPRHEHGICKGGKFLLQFLKTFHAFIKHVCQLFFKKEGLHKAFPERMDRAQRIFDLGNGLIFHHGRCSHQ